MKFKRNVKKKYLFFSTGPLHLINIFELIKQENVKNYIIYIFKSKNKNVNLEFSNTTSFLKLKNIEYLSFDSQTIINLFQYIFFINKIKIKYTNKNFVFVISDFNNFFFHLLRLFFNKSEFILIDEGYGTLIAFKKYISRGIYFPIDNYKKSILRLFKIFSPKYFEILLNSKMDIFTYFYDYFNMKNIKKNYLLNLKKKMNKDYQKDNHVVFFIGTKFYERGVISLDDELKILKKVKKYWKKKGKKLIYIAKRTTSNKKLEWIKKKLSLEYIRFNLPIEIALGVKYNKIPYAICSFSSTANFTLKKIYNIKTFYLIPKNFKKKIFFSGLDKYLIYTEKQLIVF